MYAVIETGGKQYRVQPGDVLDVEKLPAVSEDSPEVVFDRVLLVGGDDSDVRLGDPLVAGAEVHGKCLAAVRGPKLTVFKMKRRKGYRRKRGHRQDLIRVRIDDIRSAGAAPAKKARAKKASAKGSATKSAKGSATKDASAEE